MTSPGVCVEIQPTVGSKSEARVVKTPRLTVLIVVALVAGIAANAARELPGPVAREAQSKPTTSDEFDSPQMAALAEAARAGNRVAIRQFWDDAKDAIPLVERIPENDQVRLVTFLWRGGDEARELELKVAGFFPPELDQKPLRRLADTDVWYLTARLPVAARFTYMFTGKLGKKRAILDPLNPTKHGYASLLELPGAPPQPWIRTQPDAPKGTLQAEKIRSAILKEERTFSIYTPASGDRTRRPSGLLVLFDGEAYRDEIPTATILDNLLAAQKIPPLVALLVDSGKTRDRDLQCSSTFADFLAQELLPWARQRYQFSADPEQVIVGGSSYGGLAAAHAAFRHPEVFGSVLSQSGSFGYYPGWDRGDRTDSSPFGWLIRQFATTRRLPIRFYLEAGLFETGHSGSNLAENRRMRDVLDAKGYSVVYSEFAGGHEYLNWRGSVADGLIALAGQRR
jgi:enterochelin esterase family protein